MKSKKGFMSISIIYSFLILFLLLMFSILISYSNRINMINSLVIESKEMLKTNNDNLVVLVLSETESDLIIENQKQITISGSNYGTLSCSTSNASIATCSISGTTLTVTGVAAGSATITVEEDILNKTATYAVTVNDVTLTLSPTSGSVVKTKTVTSTIGGSNYGALSCTTSNSWLATCSISGTTLTVTGVAVGSATITVKEDILNKTATYAVTIEQQVTIPTQPTSAQS